MGNEVARAAFAACLAVLAAFSPGCASGGDESPAPAAADGAAVGEWERDGYRLALVETDGECRLRYWSPGGEGEIGTEFAAPCRFVLEPSGERPMSVVYEDADNATVLIVVAEPFDDPDAPEDSAVFCGQYSRGVLLRPGSVRMSDRIAEGRICANGQDEKEFWLFAH